MFNLDDVQVLINRFPGTTTVFLGPVGDDNRDEVERLKDLVDGALG